MLQQENAQSQLLVMRTVIGSSHCGIVTVFSCRSPLLRYNFGPLTSSRADLVMCLEPCKKKPRIGPTEQRGIAGHDALKCSPLLGRLPQ